MKFKLFTKSASEPKTSVKKSYTGACLPMFNPIEFANTLISRGEGNFGFPLLNTFYNLCAPVSDSIDRIAKEIATLKPYLYDIEQSEFVKTSILDIFKNPGPWLSQSQFFYNVAATYLISGNVFLYVAGVTQINELGYIEPQYINFKTANNQIIDAITYEKNLTSETFYLQNILNKSFFISPSGKKGLLLQMYNPKGGQKDSFFGISRLVSISQEILQYVLSSKHNINLLQNGAKLSGILKTGDLTTDQLETLQMQIDRYYSGAENAGRVMVVENGLGFDGSVMSNTDMDYRTMRQEVKKAIYDRFEIPTALISDSAMTYNNLEVARLMLYENSVLPIAKTIFKHLQDLIFPYYDIDPNMYEIRYDENEIGVLRFRNSQIMSEMRQAGCFTMNDIRSVGGWEKLSSGGDTVYGNVGAVPLAESYEDDSQLEPMTDGAADTKPADPTA